jgi:hypothetical protein
VVELLASLYSGALHPESASDLGELLTSGSFSDLTLVAEGVDFKVHKVSTSKPSFTRIFFFFLSFWA